MKTKLLLTAFLFVAFLDNIVAQEYHPMLNDATWILRDHVNCCRLPQTKTIEPAVDEVIGSYTYKKFIDPFASSGNTFSYVYLREDEDERRVYNLVNDTEVILYDFSLLQGDVYGSFNVDVDYIDINGMNRKRIKLSRHDDDHDIDLTQTWIEGVGSPAHPFRPTCNMYNALSSSGGRSINLVCSFQDGQHIYGNQDCEALLLDTEENVVANSGVNFSPNPFVNKLVIRSETLLQNATFNLYNMQGQLVHQIGNLSGFSVSVNHENLSSGLYFAQLFENNKLIKTSKLIVQ